MIYKTLQYEETVYQRSEYKEDNESSAEGSLAGDVAVSDRCHGYDDEIGAIPVREVLRVVEVGKRIARVLQLKDDSRKNNKDFPMFKRITIVI